MNISETIKIKKVPQFNDDIVVTYCTDGTPCSHIYDDNWDYSGGEKRGKGKKARVPFHTIDSRFRKGVQSTIWYICEEHKSRHKTALTSSQVGTIKDGLVRICEALGSCNWSVLSDDRIYKSFERNLVRSLQGRSVSTTYIERIVSAFNQLNRHNLLHRYIDGKVFKSKFQYKDTVQSVAIPIAIYQAILTDAIQTVETYHEHRHEIARVMKIFHEIYVEEKNSKTKSQEVNAVSQRVLRRVSQIKHDIPDFSIKGDGVALGIIMRHCMLVTLAFSGVRIGEALSLSKDSYEIRVANGNEVPVIKGETTKGNDGIPKNVTWQTHPIVKDALELAYDMTENLRTMYKQRINEQLNDGVLTLEKHQTAMDEVNGAFIPLRPFIVQSTYVQTNLSAKLIEMIRYYTATKADVNEFDQLNPSRAGKLKVGGFLPKLSPHDFRRTFAVFFKRYGFGSAATIKFQYKHDNINMSEYYQNNADLQAMEDILLDADLLKIMNDEGIEMAIDAFDEVYNKSEGLSGVEGERIAKDKFKELKDGHDIYMTRTEIEVLVRNGSLAIVKLPTGGYCTNSTCSRVGGITQFSTDKKACIHQIVTDNQAKVILRQNSRLIKTFRALNTGDPLECSNLIALKQKIKRNEITIQKHNLKYEAFNDEVKSIIVMQEA